MSPAEFHLTMEVYRDVRFEEVKHNHEVSRYQAWVIVNHTSTILKKRLDHPRDLGLFVWESKDDGPIQTLEEMKKNMEQVALAMGGVVVAKGPDDPPRVLASKNKK